MRTPMNMAARYNGKPIICTFADGPLEGIYCLGDVMRDFPVTKYTEDLTEVRKNGGWCHRAELDNRPEVKGYCGPMWDGEDGECIYFRYETWELYNMMFD